MELVHFVIAEQWNDSPANVNDVWDAPLVEDAILIMERRGRFTPSKPRANSPFNDVAWGGIRLDESS